MSEKLVSVIMSTKDTNKEMLKESVDSILYQTYKNIEFLIMCDGSENDYNFLKDYNDPRIKILKHEKSKGLTKSLNELLEIAKGEYIARMDSDDISLKNRLKTQVKFLEKNKDVDICTSFTKSFGKRNAINFNLFNKPEGVKAQLLFHCCIFHPTVMIRKSFLDKNNLRYNEEFKYAQDYELWTRCSEITKIYIIPKILLKYRLHNGQISIDKLEEQNYLCSRINERCLYNLGIENPESKVKYLFYLTSKNENEINKSDLKAFINEIIECNRKKKMYNEKIIKNIIRYRKFVINLKKVFKRENKNENR